MHRIEMNKIARNIKLFFLSFKTDVDREPEIYGPIFAVTRKGCLALDRQKALHFVKQKRARAYTRTHKIPFGDLMKVYTFLFVPAIAAFFPLPATNNVCFAHIRPIWDENRYTQFSAQLQNWKFVHSKYNLMLSLFAATEYTFSNRKLGGTWMPGSF